MAATIISIISRKTAASTGARRYFTGLPCNSGHVAERYVNGKKCVECMRAKNAQNRLAKSEYFQAYRVERYKNKSEEIKQYNSSWRKNNAERYAQIRRKSREKNAAAISASTAAYQRKKYAESPEYRCIKTLKVRFLIALRDAKIKKEGSFTKALGYSGAELVAHLERQFHKGMSWGNHGEWHIDHITPVSVLVRQGITDPAVVNCLTNLRPIWAKDNLTKGAKLTVLL